MAHRLRQMCGHKQPTPSLASTSPSSTVIDSSTCRMLGLYHLTVATPTLDVRRPAPPPISALRRGCSGPERDTGPSQLQFRRDIQLNARQRSTWATKGCSSFLLPSTRPWATSSPSISLAGESKRSDPAEQDDVDDQETPETIALPNPPAMRPARLLTADSTAGSSASETTQMPRLEYGT